MIRLMLLLLLLPVALWAIVALNRLLSRPDIDWNGVAFAAGFVALAFYLRHATGMG